VPTRTSSHSAALRSAVVGSAAGKAVELATLVLLATVVPRTLGPSDFGQFSVALTLVTLGSLLLTLGSPTLMARLVPEAPADERVGLARALGRRLSIDRAVPVTVLAFAVLALALWDRSIVSPLDAVLVFSAFALNIATSLALQVALGLGHTGPWSARWPLQNSTLIVGVLVLHPIAGITGTLVAILVAAAVGAGFAAVVLVNVASGSHPRVDLPPGTTRFGVLLAGGAAFAQFAQRGGVLAVALLGGSSRQVGYAALAIGIALGVTYAVLQSFPVALPHLVAHAAAETGPTTAEATLRRMAGAALAVLVPACAIAAVSLDTVVPALFGEDFASASAAFGPALAVLVLAPMSSLLTQAAALRNRPHAEFTSGALGAVAFVIAAVVAVPIWDAAGGTAAVLVGGAAAAVAESRMLPRASGRALTAASLLGATAVLALSFT
jgi:O-antigen/teichoic acid export membrane protein